MREFPAQHQTGFVLLRHELLLFLDKTKKRRFLYGRKRVDRHFLYHTLYRPRKKHAQNMPVRIQTASAPKQPCAWPQTPAVRINHSAVSHSPRRHPARHSTTRYVITQRRRFLLTPGPYPVNCTQKRPAMSCRPFGLSPVFVTHQKPPRNALIMA